MSVEITQFKRFEKNTLKGFLTVRLPGIGLEIRDICLHEKNGKKWLQLPSKPHQKQDGSQSWSFILTFFDQQKGDQFQAAALKALDQYQRGGQA